MLFRSLYERGWKPILSGRNAEKLNSLRSEYPQSEIGVASGDDPQSLNGAIAGASAVINCAGPFIDTAIPIIEAALRSRIHYLDIAAEQAAVLAVFERFSRAALEAGIVIAPAMACNEWAGQDQRRCYSRRSLRPLKLFECACSGACFG